MARPKGTACGDHNSRAVLTWEQVDQIRRERRTDIHYARLFGCSDDAVRLARIGATWTRANKQLELPL